MNRRRNIPGMKLLHEIPLVERPNYFKLIVTDKVVNTEQGSIAGIRQVNRRRNDTGMK